MAVTPRTLATLEAIPARQQRYCTCGDWQFFPNDECLISVSAQEDWRHELLIAIHELVEAALCRQRGISQKAVDAFDMAFEQGRDLGDESEPGDAPDAPYRREHRFAENIERQLAHELGVNWREYDEALQKSCHNGQE